MYILGWGLEVRTNAPLIEWLHSMGQEPVTYDEGAAVFHHLQAEAFLEVGADDERDAVGLFEALSKTSIHLHYEELRRRTPVDFDFERNRLSQSSPLLFGELFPPKFTILAAHVSRPCRPELLCELDPTPESRSGEFPKEILASSDHDSLQQESEASTYEQNGDLKDDLEETGASKSDSKSLFDVQAKPDEANIIIEHNQGISSVTDDFRLYRKPDAQQEQRMSLKPVLLRIDTGRSEKHRPRVIEISKPQRKIDIVQRNEESELPDLETYLQRYFLQYPEPQEQFFGATVRISDSDDCAICQAKDLEEIDNGKSEMLNVSGLLSPTQDSPYILPNLPEFESLTPKVMEFLFEKELEDMRNHDL